MTSILRVLDWLSLATTLNESKRVLPTATLVPRARQMLEEFCESNAGNIGRRSRPICLTFDTNRDITRISQEGSHDPEWNADLPESCSILRVVDIIRCRTFD